ncbi:MAG: hypothetical protein Q9218_008293, partial [Villophora microphyllina]
MGGLLAAEVALLLSKHQSLANTRYRIIGTINLDTPFLGMHPSIVVSGLSSLFKSAPEQSNVPATTFSEQDPRIEASGSNAALSAISLSSFPTSEPDLTPTVATPLDLRPYPSAPPFASNDSFSSVASDGYPPKQSPWSRAFYFFNKHSGDLTKATKAYFTSHLEFGGCLADPKGLMSRFSRLKALDDGERRDRVRFVNYYTASTGRPKREKVTGSVSPEKGLGSPKHETGAGAPEQQMEALDPAAMDSGFQTHDPESSIEREGNEAFPSTEALSKEISDYEPLTIDQLFVDLSLQSTPISDINAPSTKNPSPSPIQPADDLLPSIPDRPTEPPPFEPSRYTDKASVKLASRDHASQVKAYQRAVKARDKAITDRRKVLAKRAKEREGKVAK